LRGTIGAELVREFKAGRALCKVLGSREAVAAFEEERGVSEFLVEVKDLVRLDLDLCRLRLSGFE